MKLSLTFLLLTGLVVTLAEPIVPQRGVIHEIKSGVGGPNPYIFLTVPRGRSQSIVQGFEVVEDEEDEDADEPVNVRRKNSLVNKQNDDDEEEDGAAADDDDLMDEQYANDDDEEEGEHSSEEKTMNSEGSPKSNVPMKNRQPSQMMVSREHAGAIMVPDEIIEIEGQSVVDEKTGKTAFLLPRSVLDSIPDGSVVALLEQSAEGRSEERANRVIVRRRRKGSRRNVKRRRVNNNNLRRRRRGGNKRRRGNNNRVRVVQVNGNRRRNVRRGGGNRRRVVYQG